MKKFIAGTALFAVMFMCVPAHAELGLEDAQKGRIGAEAIMWWPTLTGDITFNTDEVDGTEIDMVDMLGLDETVMDFELGLWLNVTKRNKLSFYWFSDQRTGSAKLEKTLTIAGKDYIASAKIDGDINVNRYKALYERSLFRNDLFRLALAVGVSYFDTIAEVEGVALEGVYEVKDSTQKRVQFALPVIGGAAELYLPLGFGLFVEGCGMGLGYDYANGKYFDVRGGANWRTRFFFVQGGYQYLEMSANAFDKLDVVYSLGGPFIAAGAKF